MKNNYKNMQALDDLLYKYHFKKSVPTGIQDYIFFRKRKNLVSLLKKVGWYSPFFGVVIYVFFWLRRIGFKSSVVQATVVLVTVSLMTISSLIFGTSYVLKNIIKEDHPQKISNLEFEEINLDSDSIAPPSKKKNREEIKSDTDKNLNPRKPDPKEKEKKRLDVLPDFKNIIYFYPTETIKVDPKFINELAKQLKAKLISLRGPKKVIAKDQDKNKADIFVFSSVEKISDDYYIFSLKAIDKINGEIIFISSKEVFNMLQLKEVGVKEVKLLSEKIK